MRGKRFSIYTDWTLVRFGIRCLHFVTLAAPMKHLFSAILLLISIATAHAQFVNVSQGKPTSGDTAFGYPTSNGVDGTTSTFTHANNTNTAPNNPFWQVDLSQNYDLTRLEITDRSDGCCNPNRLNGSEIRVYNASNVQIGATIPIAGLTTPSSSQTLVFTNGATGWPGARRIRIDGFNQYFQVAEFPLLLLGNGQLRVVGLVGTKIHD